MFVVKVSRRPPPATRSASLTTAYCLAFAFCPTPNAQCPLPKVPIATMNNGDACDTTHGNYGHVLHRVARVPLLHP